MNHIIHVLGNCEDTQKKQFLWYTVKKKFLWIKESFVNSEKFSLIQKNRFIYINEHFFESTKLSSIQRNFFFDSISKKCFFESKKLFLGPDVLYCLFLYYPKFQTDNLWSEKIILHELYWNLVTLINQTTWRQWLQLQYGRLFINK